jgi:hypothetical protein
MVIAPMSRSKRAAQFAMFDALKGLKEAIAAKEKRPEQKIILAEDAAAELNDTLASVSKGMVITVVYYCTYGQEHKQITGTIQKVDPYWKTLQIGNMVIDFCDIVKLGLLS